MSVCNYCTYQRMKQKAKDKNFIVTVLNDATRGMGGVNVYVHPPEIVIKDLPGGEDGERAKYRQGWFMSLPNHCAC